MQPVNSESSLLGYAADGLAVLAKVYSDNRQIIKLSDLLDGGGGDVEGIPAPFRHAVAVASVDSDAKATQLARQNAPLLDWYQLIESCEALLIMKSLLGKWHLPCVTARRLAGTCECPFIAHVPKADWESLHVALRTSAMRWLLTKCSVFVPIGGRAWLQVSGPLDKGQLEHAYPASFVGQRRAMKRKRDEEPSARRAQSYRSTSVASVQRPLKKVRLDGHTFRLVLPVVRRAGDETTTTTTTNEETPSPPSIVPRLAKIRVHRPNATPVVVTLMTPNGRQLASCADGRKRRGKKRTRARQIADKRRAIDGSILVPHDEILYSASGWTHFAIEHPLCRNNPAEAVRTIVGTDVGTQCSDTADLRIFNELVGAMVRNHERCRYAAILRNILASAAEYDPASSSVPVERVEQYMKCVVKKVVPVGLLGDERNLRTFLSNVKHFVRAGRGASFKLSELMHSMRTAKCRWLSHLSSLPMQVSLLARLVLWLFRQFVKPLVRQHFYATESSQGRNRVYFYAKDVWQRMNNRMMRCACAVSLKHRMPLVGKSEENAAAFMVRSRLRFVPKRNGHRPIMSTKFRESSTKEVASVRLLLHTLSGLFPEGMDPRSMHSLHCKWLEFLRRRGDAARPTYFVHADIEDAFGSIDHEKLVGILRRIGAVLPDELRARTMCHVSPGGRRSRNFKVIPHFHATNADEWVKRLAAGSVVFHMQHAPERVDTKKLLEFAIRSVLEVQVVHGSCESYRLRRGIPQGSRLSSALCHIYYGHMVQEHLSEFLNHPDDLLARVVDDFLYMTPSEDRARRFYRRIHEGFADYNAYVNVAKSVTNLDLSRDGGVSHSPPAWVSFCGLQFNWRTLETRGDYDRYEGSDIIDCITPSAGQPGELLLQRLQGVATLKIETMHLDSAVNRKPTVVRSVFHASLMAAFRFHAIVRHIMMRSVPLRRRNTPVDARFLARRVIKECCTRMIGHLSAVRRRRKDVKIALTNSETAWLCYEAFHRKLAKHRSLYNHLLPVVAEFRAASQAELTPQRIAKLRKWVGKRIPIAFRRMKHKSRKKSV